MRIVYFLIAGLGVGAFSGALGVGGALLATPVLRLLGLPPYLAVGTTVPVMLPTTATGAITYLRSGMVNKKAAVLTALTGAGAAVAGAVSTHFVNGHLLMLITALLLMYTAFRLIPGKQLESTSQEMLDSAPGYLTLGGVSGYASGLLGIGGGFLMVPSFIEFFRFPTKTAIGTSLSVIAMTVVPNTIAQTYVGNIDWKVAFALAIGVIPGARLGALISIRAKERRLRYALASVMGVIAAIYAVIEISQLS